MDLQKLFDMIGETARDTRKNYHLTLGQLIFALNMWNEAGKGDRPVVLDNFRSVGNPHSYRGYYADLAFEPTSEGITVAELLKDLRENILNQMLEGYKGGDFLMGEDTPLWVSNYGCSDQEAIINVDNYTNADGQNVIMLILKKMEY